MRRPNLLTSVAAAAALSVAIGFGSTASAQEDYPEETLQSFAVAALQIQEINMQAQEELQAAETPEDQEQVQEDATQMMMQAIEAEGLSVEEYNEIATAAQSDPDLAGQIEEYAVEAQ